MNFTGSAAANWDTTFIGGGTGSLGTLNHNSTGTISVWTLQLGADPGTGGGTGTVTQSAGLITTRSNGSNIGSGGGDGRYHITGGEYRNQTTLTVGNGAGSTGSVRIDGGTFRSTTGGVVMYVGNNGGAGTILQSNGSLSYDHIRFGETAGSSGVYHQTGGANSGWTFNAGNNGAATVTIDGGTTTPSRGTNFAQGSTGSTTFTMTGGTFSSSSVDNGFLFGGAGTAVGTQTGGFVDVAGDGWISIGRDSGGSATYTLSGGTLQTRSGESTVHVAQNAGSTGVFTLTGSGVLDTGNLRIGAGGGSNGTVNLEGGTLRTNGMINNGGTFVWIGTTITYLTQFG